MVIYLPSYSDVLFHFHAFSYLEQEWDGRKFPTSKRFEFECRYSYLLQDSSIAATISKNFLFRVTDEVVHFKSKCRKMFDSVVTKFAKL